mmetsp:Transcript_20696/g.57204  ORF Transcript_20696/g.57204 Transcript_20696/m.57204 type:complete len:238 (-) Transcript_20696:398-1111(-)
MAVAALLSILTSLRLPEPCARSALSCAVNNRANRGRRLPHFCGDRLTLWHLLLLLLLGGFQQAVGARAEGGKLCLLPQLDLALRAEVAVATLATTEAALWLPMPDAGAALPAAVCAGATRGRRSGLGETRRRPGLPRRGGLATGLAAAGLHRALGRQHRIQLQVQTLLCRHRIGGCCGCGCGSCSTPSCPHEERVVSRRAATAVLCVRRILLLGNDRGPATHQAKALRCALGGGHGR